MAKRMTALQRKYFSKKKGARKASPRAAWRAGSVRLRPAVKWRTRTVVKRSKGAGPGAVEAVFARKSVPDTVLGALKLAGALVAGAGAAQLVAKAVGRGDVRLEALATGAAGVALGRAAKRVSRLVGGAVAARTVRTAAAGMVADAGMRATATLRAAGRIPLVSRTNRGLLAGVGVVDPHDNRNAGFRAMHALAD